MDGARLFPVPRPTEPLADPRVAFATERLLAAVDVDAKNREPSDVWRDCRWAVRRWTPRHLFYRLRLPVRRRRWIAQRVVSTSRHVKDPCVRRTGGPAVAFGEFSGSHGLGRAAAYDVERLRDEHASLETIDIGPYLRGRAARPLAFSQPIENVYLLCQPDTYDVVCGLITSDDMAHAWRVGRWVWETPLFPRDWRFAEALVHEVWTPSEFCASTFREALSIPVRVVPHAVQTPIETGIDMRARIGIGRDRILGLAIMDIRSCPERKNPWAHVLAWQRAFGGDPTYQLVMKLRVGKRTRVVLDELRELVGRDRNIRILTDDFSDEEIAALHRAGDLYLSLHRSEGFGLNIYEALLLGKPVVATDWSANAEYGPSFPNYLPVRPRLEPYRDWTGHYADRAFRWA